MTAIPHNTIIYGDARKVLCELPKDLNAVIITDPVWPNAHPGLIGSDKPYELFAETARYFPRIAKRVIVQLGCDSDPRFLTGVPKELPFLRSAMLRYTVPSHEGRLLRGFDLAFIFGSWPASAPGRRVLPGEFTLTEGRYIRPNHPCPRRLSHVMWLVSRYTEEGDLIIDPFLGSGTTAVAADLLGRKWIGIEINADYIEIANQRLVQCREQQKLELA